MTSTNSGNLKIITKVEITGKWCKIYVENEQDKIYSKYGYLINAIEEANLYEYVINYGCVGLLLELDNHLEIVKIHALPNMSQRINKK